MNKKELSLIMLKILLLTVVLVAVNGAGSLLLPTTENAPPDPAAVATDPPPAQSSGSFFAVLFVVLLLQTVALAYPVLRARWHGWRLVATVALLYFGTVTFMSQIESLIYLGGKMPEGMVRGLFAMGLFNAVVFAPILVLVLGKWRSESGADAPRASTQEPRHGLGPWLSRALLAGAAYLALYYLFGYYVAWQDPGLREYYGGTDPGSFIAQILSVVRATPWMLPVQFVRGLLWVGLGLLVVRMMRGGWWESGLALAMLFAMPSFYLLLPNEMMPEPIRMAHLVETLPYQFLFGWLVAWLFRAARLVAAGSDTDPAGQRRARQGA